MQLNRANRIQASTQGRDIKYEFNVIIEKRCLNEIVFPFQCQKYL